MTNFCIFGCGALGSQIAMHLASSDNVFYLIDDDRVDENNVSTCTSAFGIQHIGALKVNCLAEMLWYKGKSIATPINTTITRSNIATLNIPDDCMILDCFDNMESRSIIIWGMSIPRGARILHVGVSLQRTGAVLWNGRFEIPKEITPRGENQVCTNQLGAPILRLTSAIAVSVLEQFINNGTRNNYLVTESLEVKHLDI